MKAHPSQAEGDAIARMVLDVVREVRRSIRDDRAARVDSAHTHVHTCRWCSAHWDES